jgi:DNA primase small subunit
MPNLSGLVKQKFSEYYRTHSARIQPPTDFRRREFGFILFDRGIMVRHQGYHQFDDVRDFLQSTVPSHTYYSAALYERPGETMDRKGWLGTDLMFDIDFDHIPTACKKNHEYWICTRCDHTGTGRRPEVCPHCGENKFKDEAWLCETCLERSKSETLKLINFLIKDFGFGQEEIEVIFSGHRGYHVHIEEMEVRHLNQASRREIVDYVLGTGLVPELHGLKPVSALWDKKTKQSIGPDLNDPGWRGRIAKGVYNVISNQNIVSSIDRLQPKKKKYLTINRNDILDAWDRKSIYSGFPLFWDAFKDINSKDWLKLSNTGVKGLASEVDTVVTTDTRRLIRLPLSLHGKTGLRVMNVPINSLEKFDPLTEAIAFQKGRLRIHVNEAHAFRMGDTTYGPFDRETVELPSAAALYLLCKKAAIPISTSGFPRSGKPMKVKRP